MAETATVLIVDDEPRVLDSLEALLAMEHRVLRADRGDEALSLLAAEPVAVILSDQRMPGMLGTDLLARFAESDPRDLGEMLAAAIQGNRDPAAALAALAASLDWRPELGTALARALLSAGATKTANAVLLVLQHAAREGGGR